MGDGSLLLSRNCPPLRGSHTYPISTLLAISLAALLVSLEDEATLSGLEGYVPY